MTPKPLHFSVVVVHADIRTLNIDKGNFLKENVNDYTFIPRIAGIINRDNTVNVKKFFTVDAIPSKLLSISNKDEKLDQYEEWDDNINNF